MKKKLRSQSGETLVETLLAILVIAIAIAFLSTAVVSAARINAALHNMRQDFSYSGAAVSENRGTVEVIVGSNSKTAQETIYEYNDYYFYGD